MVRLPLLIVLVFCLVGQMECGNSTSRDRPYRVNEMYKPVLNKLFEIKETLEAIKDQGGMAATKQLNQTQPEDLQQSTCPTCGEYEVCNTTKSTCELKGCDQVSDLVDEITDENITASSYYSYSSYTPENNFKFYGPHRSRLNSSYRWRPATQSSDEYLQFEFQDMKIVQAIVSVLTNVYHYVSIYNLTTSTDCETFTSTLLIEPGDNYTETSTFPEPVLAKCVRVHAANRTGNIQMRIGLLGCKAE